MQIIPITKLIMDDICKNKNDAYQVAFYKLENFDLEKIICLNIEKYNCNKYRINDLSWIKNQNLLNRPDILIMKPTTKLTEGEQQILLDLNIKVYYVNEKILLDNDLLKKTINEIERKIYKSKTLKYFEVEKQNIKNIEEKYKNLENNELEKKL